MSLHPKLAASAGTQRGLFTGAQARDVGYDAAEIKRLVRRGLWTRVRRGVYIESVLMPDDPAVTHALMARAVLLRLRGPAFISHLSAIAVHDLPTYLPDWSTVHITRPGLPSTRTEAGVHHHTAKVPADHLARLAGTAVTSPARSIIDLARESTFAQGLVTAEAALWRGAVTLASLRDVLFVCLDWPGAKMAGRVVSFASTKSQTPGETLARIAFEMQGIAQPQQQVPVFDRRGLVGHVDFLWSTFRTIGEFDGRLKYEGDLARLDTLYDEKRREDRLRELGFEVVRFGYADTLSGQARLAARLRAAFARGGKRTA